jgi:hypothetical protein
MSHFLIVASSLIAIAIAVVGAFLGFVRPTTLPLRLPVLAVFVLPNAAILALFFSRRLRAYAFTLAAGSAAVAILTLGVFAGVLLVFIGFTMGNKDQLAVALALPAYVLAQIPLGLAALAAWRKLPVAERPARALAIGIVLPLVYAALGFGSYYWYEYQHKVTSRQAAANDAAAAVAIKRAVECLASNREAHGGSFPGSFDAVRSCLGGDARSAFAGYRVSYVPALPDSNGRVGIYSLCAEAEKVGSTGWHTYVADEEGSGDAYAFDYDSLKAPSCGGAWFHAQLLRRVKHCVVAYAAKNPREGYPASLLQLGDQGNRCLTEAGDVRGLDAVSVGAFDFAVGYRPGPAESDGRVLRFELSAVVRGGKASYNLMIDETGARHASAEGSAKRGDPTPEQVLERLAARARETRTELAAFAERCEQASAADCALLGYRQWDETSNYARALEAWRKACELKDREGCLFVLSQEKDNDVFVFTLSDKRDCVKGDAVACKRLARLVAHFEGCNQEERPADCAEIAYRYARGGNTHRANQIWEAACDKRHKESCLLAKTRDFDYIKVFELKDRCVTGEDVACTELAKRVEEMVSLK